ncbi:MAG: T9SS type A sorting domain-containing protein, partial [bacterium]
CSWKNRIQFPTQNNIDPIIRYEISKGMNLTLKIYNLAGEEIASLVNGYRDAGIYEVRWDVSAQNKPLPSGVYIYRLTGDDFFIARKMILIH